MTSEYLLFSSGHLDFFYPLWEYEGLGEYLGHIMANPNIHMRTIVKENLILGLAWVSIIHPGVGEVSTMPSIYMPDNSFSYIKQVKKLIKEECEENYKCHRVQAAIDITDEVSRHWIEKLGFKGEGVMKEWHKNRDHYLYARIKEWPQEQ
jgi:hypothetical protein